MRDTPRSAAARAARPERWSEGAPEGAETTSTSVHPPAPPTPVPSAL